MTLKQELFFLLKEGYSFSNACYRLGIEPWEGSKLLHGGRKKKEITQKVKYTFCVNRVCRSCSDDSCCLRNQEQD